MAAAFGWKDAWDEYDEHDPSEMYGVEHYSLPAVEDGFQRTIYPGDRFWDTSERYVIEVTSVRTKVYRGVVGPKGEEGNDAVFYDPDWRPPTVPSDPEPNYEEVHFDSVECFATRIHEGDLVAHRGNGVRLPP